MPGGEAKLGLFERLGRKEKPIFEELPLGTEMAEHVVASRWIDGHWSMLEGRR